MTNEKEKRVVVENTEQKSVTHFRPVTTATRPEFEFPEQQQKPEKRRSS